mmetsp:Transcript_38976/g.122097  ORF Transcript_38976/g.122097 Transcript_38976/m.122097 type:complete len:254 (-) Transcript_38976:604-1365(-)
MRPIQFFPKPRKAPAPKATGSPASVAATAAEFRALRYDESEHVKTLHQQISEMEHELSYLGRRGLRSGASRSRAMTILASLLLFKKSYLTLTGKWIRQRSSSGSGLSDLAPVEETDEEEEYNGVVDATTVMRKAAGAHVLEGAVASRQRKAVAGAWSTWRSMVHAAQKAEIEHLKRTVSLMRASCMLPQARGSGAVGGYEAPHPKARILAPRPIPSRYIMPVSGLGLREKDPFGSKGSSLEDSPFEAFTSVEA